MQRKGEFELVRSDRPPEKLRSATKVNLLLFVAFRNFSEVLPRDNPG